MEEIGWQLWRLGDSSWRRLGVIGDWVTESLEEIGDSHWRLEKVIGGDWVTVIGGDWVKSLEKNRLHSHWRRLGEVIGEEWVTQSLEEIG